jgi:hypothetical protein
MSDSLIDGLRYGVPEESCCEHSKEDHYFIWCEDICNDNHLYCSKCKCVVYSPYTESPWYNAEWIKERDAE